MIAGLLALGVGGVVGAGLLRERRWWRGLHLGRFAAKLGNRMTTEFVSSPESALPAAPEKAPRIRDLSLCPCKSRLAYGLCCGPYHAGKAKPETAEQLMRSRYSAYFFGKIDYLVDTTHPDKKAPGMREAIQDLADQARWSFLTVLSASQGQKGDRTGKVEFVAEFYVDGVRREHREKSRFRRCRGNWKYVDDKG